MKKVTIKDIAKEAGVSVATVSNVINGIKKCKPETKDRILKVMEALNYKQNLAAKALATNRSNLIGFVLNKGLLQENPFYSTLLSGMDSAIRKSENYDLLIAGAFKDSTGEFSVTDWIQKRSLDAVVFMGITDEEILKDVDKLGIPMVLIDLKFESLKNAFFITIDDELGGYLATKHLIEKGYRNIAFIGGKCIDGIMKERYEGYLRAHLEAELEPSEKNIFLENVSYEGGLKVGESLLSAEGIDAIFCVADIMAFGIMKTLSKSDKNIPKNLAIIGFDNLKSSEYIIPALTTIDQNIFLKGKKSIEILLEKLEGKSIDDKNIVIPIRLIEGETT